jgi:DNA-binding transcriptional MerR regulator
MSERSEGRLRIGELATRVGVTPRTIRYYEELGLLAASDGRGKGAHRLYGSADIERLEGLIRLRDLLGLTLEELVGLAEADQARAGLRDQWADDPSDAERVDILEAAIPLVSHQLELVQARQARLDDFAQELTAKLRSLHETRARLLAGRPGMTADAA